MAAIIVSDIPAALPAGCSTPTAIAGLTGYGHGWRTAITGTSIRDICSATSQRTFCGCAVRRWIGSGWRGVTPGRNSISVARREAVARLDEFVGPKY